MKLTIDLDEDEKKILTKRAKKNLMTIKEQVEDIVRRSCVTYKGGTGYKPMKSDDALVEIFSRERRGGQIGRKRKRKK